MALAGEPHASAPRARRRGCAKRKGGLARRAGFIDSLKTRGTPLLVLELGDFMESDTLKGSVVNPFLLDRMEAEGTAAIIPSVLEINAWPRLQRFLAGRSIPLLLANVSFSWRLAQSVASVEISPLVELRNVKELVRDGETIHVRDDQHTDLLWTTYFLKDYNLSLAHYSPYYLGQDWPFYRKAIAADLVLVRKPGSSATTWAGEVVHENGRYANTIRPSGPWKM